MTDLKYKLLIEAEADTKGIGKLQKELSALYKDQKKASSTAAAALVKQQAKTKDLDKLTGPGASRKQLASKKEELRLEKQLTDEVRKQTTERRKLLAANKLAERNTFRGGLRRSLGMRQAGDPDGPNWRSRLGSAVGGAFRTGIGMAGGGLAALSMAPVAAVGAQYQAYSAYSRSLAQVSGMGRGMPFGRGGVTSESIRGLAGRGADLGFMPEESVDALHSMGRAVGTRGATGATDLAMGASRLTGQSIPELAAFMTEQRRGSGSFGTQQRREFQQTLQAAVEAGMDASTLPEYMEGIQTILQGNNGRGGTTSASQVASLLAMAQRTGIAGLQGARGAQTLTGVNAGVTGAGNVNLGLQPLFHAMMMQEAGLGRGESYSGAAGRLQQGIFQDGGIGIGGVRHVVNSARGAGLSGSDLNQGIVDAGMAQTQAQAGEIVRMLDAQGTDEQLRTLLEHTSETELDVQHEIATNTQRIADLLGAYSNTQNHGVIGAARTALDNVDLGHEVAGPLEELQRIMQQFIEGPMHDLIDDVLTELPPLLRTVTDSISQVAAAVHSMAHPGEGTASVSEYGSFQSSFGATGAALSQWQAYQDSAETETPEQLRALMARVQGLNDQYVRLENNPIISDLIQVSGNQAAADTDQQRRLAALEQIATALASQATQTSNASTATMTDGVMRIVTSMSVLNEGLRTAPTDQPRTSVSSTGTGR